MGGSVIDMDGVTTVGTGTWTGDAGITDGITTVGTDTGIGTVGTNDPGVGT